MDITLTNKSNSRKFKFPFLPESVSFSSAVQYASYNILDLGAVAIPNGKELRSVSWEGVFYGEARKDILPMRKWVEPKECQTLLSQWRDAGSVLKLVISETPINMDVTISSFQATYAGAFGDYAYSIVFQEYRKPSIDVTKKKAKSTSKAKPKTTKRATTQKKSYPIKPDDTLWAIAQNIYGSGSKWTKIYDANKSTIESAAKKHRKGKGSDHGHWIYPGTVLTIPE